MTATPGPLFALALASISLIGPLAVHLFLPAIPAVKAALGLSDALAQLTFSIALFGMACATLVYGSLSDRYGRRPVLLSGLMLFLVGSAISAATTSVLALIVGRLVQAVGAGCGITLGRAIAQDVYGRDRLVKAIAYLTMAYTLGPMVAPLVGGILIDAFGWRSVFGFALALGAVIALVAYAVVFETRPPSPENRGGGNVLRNYAALFRHIRFTAFVLQSGFVSGTFLATATAASSLLKDMLHRPSTEFGLYFLLFPFGLLAGNFVSSRIGNRVANETMVLAGSLILLAAVATQSSLLLSGHVTPLTLFAPAFFITMAQGISLPYAQSGAMATNPKLAGTAAGVGVFVQNFCGAAFAQLYGLLADGTPGPLTVTTAISVLFALGAGVLPFLMARKARPA
ncbi:MAG TPA: multidrug effflux MFS transporter [Xanthobacteraceae bacterium]|jgi:DHA1 family bicyclomycin/chloramphenicol resistance-like MFS transporter|nr:multidrug effflux MFS transporter [Xanthobacteraceae bacterium]